VNAREREREIERGRAGGRPDVYHIYYTERERGKKRYREKKI